MAETQIATPVVSTVKPGIKTTEFALVVFVNLVTVGMTFLGMLPAGLEAIVLAVINSVYAIARSIIKNGDPAFIPPDLPMVAVKQ